MSTRPASPAKQPAGDLTCAASGNTSESPARRKRIEAYGPTWERAANAIARNYVIIQTCRECSWPVIKGYCCTFCGSTNP